MSAKISLSRKIEVLDAIKNGMNQTEAHHEFDVSRQSINQWLKTEQQLREDYAEEKALMAVSDELPQYTERLDEMMERFEKGYLAKLDSLGDTEHRKQVFLAGLEKQAIELLAELDTREKSTLKTGDIIKGLKEIVDIREKLSNDPTIIIEVRKKVQIAVLQVVKEMFGDERLDEFVEKVKILEE